LSKESGEAQTPEEEVYDPEPEPEDIYDEPDPTLDEDRVVPFDPSAGSLPDVVHPEAWVPETPFFSGMGTLFDSEATAADRIVGGLKVGILAPLAGAELFVTGVIAAPQLAATEAIAAGEHIGRALELGARGADAAALDEWLAAAQAGSTSVAETASTVAMGALGARGRPNQLHHFATDKNRVWSPRMQKIADRYGLKLDELWNVESIPHQGRHPNEYHEFVQRGMTRAAREAGMNKKKFLELFERYVKQPVRDNPDLLRKAGWK